ncbi:MAG TPA: SPOR domain-containing protein [Burkholderiales bacterium]|nr:SPOR domain-containing protein [Burkholderiales bacterium]
MAEEQQDVETLKRRGRRRLVGAVALVLLAVIVLPMVFDPEPKSTVAPVEVRIPKETDTPFVPKPPPTKPAAKVEAAPAAPAPQPAANEYVIQVGAFARPETVTAKLKAAKLPYYTEPMPGNLTRVRAGPFASREAADQALAKLKELGLKPGAVTTKSG